MKPSHLCQGFLLRSAFFSAVRKMSFETDHLTVTASSSRDKIIATAEVRKIDNLSSTVKRLNFHIPDQHFSFKAGQWVDMFIPGVENAGGFSMCSSPDYLAKTRILQLAVKFSNHPPAYWIHTQCQVDDKVKLRVGGDFFYDPQPNTESNDLLLVAGGVGINPLYCMLQHFLFLRSSRESVSGDNHSVRNQNVSLLYSARNTEELIFQKELIQFTHCFSNFQLKMFSTQEPVSDSKYITGGRIQLRDIECALSASNKIKTDVYICGPFPFIETVKSFCVCSNIQEDRVFTERWY